MVKRPLVKLSAEGLLGGLSPVRELGEALDLVQQLPASVVGTPRPIHFITLAHMIERFHHINSMILLPTILDNQSETGSN